jgi:transcriptional regulator with XRE-family HTH domain
VASGVSPAAIRAAREKAGLTQHQLARLVGVAGGERVSRWELGTSEPRPDILVRLAQTLGLPVLALLDVDDESPDLRALRFGAGLSAAEAAVRAHVAKPTYERWEAGRWKRLPSRENLRSLARGLSVTVSATVAALEQARAQRTQSPEA